MTPIIVIAAIIFVACLLVQTIFELKKSHEYHKWEQLAKEHFGYSERAFDTCMEIAIMLYGKTAKPEDAYNIAYEEWYDEHYK